MLRALATGGMARTLMRSYSQKKQPFIRTAWPKGGRFTGCGAVLPFTPVAPLTLVCSHVLRHQIGMVGTMVRWCPPPYHTDETVKSRCNPEPFQQGMPSLFTYQFQAKPCRCSRWVASIVERIDLGYASNLMRVLIKLTGPTQPYEWY